MYTPRF